MKHLFKLFVFACGLCCCSAASIRGEIVLKKGAEGAFTKRFGDNIEVTSKWYVDDFFGRETVFAGASVKNKGSKTLAFHYFVAFYDKEHKLIGCAAQSSFKDAGLKAGEETELGSCLVKLPSSKFKEIEYFEAVVYETEALNKAN